MIRLLLTLLRGLWYLQTDGIIYRLKAAWENKSSYFLFQANKLKQKKKKNKMQTAWYWFRAEWGSNEIEVANVFPIHCVCANNRPFITCQAKKGLLFAHVQFFKNKNRLISVFFCAFFSVFFLNATFQCLSLYNVFFAKIKRAASQLAIQVASDQRCFLSFRKLTIQFLVIVVFFRYGKNAKTLPWSSAGHTGLQPIRQSGAFRRHVG